MSLDRHIQDNAVLTHPYIPKNIVFLLLSFSVSFMYRKLQTFAYMLLDCVDITIDCRVNELMVRKVSPLLRYPDAETIMPTRLAVHVPINSPHYAE